MIDRAERLVLNDQVKSVSKSEDIHTRLVAGDESWIHYLDSVTKKRVHAMDRSEVPHLRHWQVMSTFLGYFKGVILMIYYKLAGTSITQEYYSNLVKQLRVVMKKNNDGGEASHRCPSFT